MIQEYETRESKIIFMTKRKNPFLEDFHEISLVDPLKMTSIYILNSIGYIQHNNNNNNIHYIAIAFSG